eukprot:gene35759-43375_t
MTAISLWLTVFCTLGCLIYAFVPASNRSPQLHSLFRGTEWKRARLPISPAPPASDCGRFPHNGGILSVKQHAHLRHLSVDRSVLPGGSPLLQAAALAVLVLSAVWQFLRSEVAMEIQETLALPDLGEWMIQRRDGAQNGVRSLKETAAKVKVAMGSLWERISTLLFGVSETSEDAAAWKPCTFESVQDLNSKYRKYTLNLKDKATLHLAPAQKIALCAATEAGEFVKSSYFGRKVDGRVEIFAPRHHNPQLPRSASPLHQLQAPGDVLAVRGGELTLAYRGAEEVRALQLVCGGLGVVPLLSLLQRVFGPSPDPDLDVERCDVLWINDSKDDFLLLDEVSQLEQRARSRLSCVRIMDADVLAQGQVLNPSVRDELTPYSPGSVAIVATPAASAEKFLAALEELQYPAANIVYIPV